MEKDAAPSKTPIAGPVTFHTEDTTVNVMPATVGGMLKSLTDGGFQYLLAGARANVGVSAGRYMFEVKIVEFVTPAEEQARGKWPTPRQLLRVGFATSSSTLILGETEENICFTSEGVMVHNKQRTACGQTLTRDSVVAVLLNLDKKSPNCNTISIFKDGKRASQPQQLPESLQGKALFPAVTFRNMTVQVNFGPQPVQPLPFKCSMVSAADKAHASLAAPYTPPGGKYEVLFPVSLPDQGTFDWLDLFLESHREYTELSDRAIMDWCEKSGVHRHRGYGPEALSCGDKPEGSFGIPSLDDFSVRRVLRVMAPLQQRNYVVMEVKGNLTKEERMETVGRFTPPHFKRVAAVLVGEPTKDFKQRAQELVLHAKQQASDAEFRTKKAEEQQKRAIEKRQKELEKTKLKIQKQHQKEEAARKKKIEIEKKKKEIEEKKKNGEDVEEMEEEDEEDKENEEKDEQEQEEEPDENEEPPKVELTSEEKKMWFRKPPLPDLSEYTMNVTFTKFTLPEKDEGFDEVRTDWAKGTKAKEFLTQWILQRKLTTRVEDIKPSPWFNQKWGEWQRTVQGWHAKQAQWRSIEVKRMTEAASKAKQKAALAAVKAAAAKAAAAKKAEDGKEGEEEEKNDVNMEAEEDKEEDTVDLENLDVFGVRDINDIGGGMPLFRDFRVEDWTMMGLRFELHLLVHSFRRDADDPERTGIHLNHLPFYYQRYYKRALNPKNYGVESCKELLDLVEDALFISSQQVIESQLPEEMETFAMLVKLAEEDRRHRQLQLDVGNESARLNIQQGSLAQARTEQTGGSGKAAGGKAQWQPSKKGFQPALQKGIQVPVQPWKRSWGKGW